MLGKLRSPRTFYTCEGFWSYPAWIRTRTKRTKISCATVTLPGNSSVISPLFESNSPLTSIRRLASLGRTGPSRFGRAAICSAIVRRTQAWNRPWINVRHESFAADAAILLATSIRVKGDAMPARTVDPAAHVPELVVAADEQDAVYGAAVEVQEQPGDIPGSSSTSTSRTAGRC